MRKRAAPEKSRETERLRRLLKVRESQLKTAVGHLREIIGFRSAHASVFMTEVEHVQRLALVALCEMDELQRGKKNTVLGRGLLDMASARKRMERHRGVFRLLGLETTLNSAPALPGGEDDV